MPASDPDNLKLTDFMDLSTLQEIQDSFAAVANVQAVITDADDNVLTSPAPTAEFVRRQRALEAAEDKAEAVPQREGREYVAPIIVNNQRLGTLRMSGENGKIEGFDDARLQQLADKYGIDFKQMKALALQLTRNRQAKPAAIQFLYLLANAIARLCFQEFQLRQRINELTAVYNVTMMLADARDLKKVLQRTVEVVSEVMKAKAASIRLIDQENDELRIRAVHNLSPEYLNKGPIRLSKAEIDRVALSGRGYEYVRDMTADPRVLYPEESRREGLVSLLSIGMRYKGRPVGVLRIYSGEERAFSQMEIDLLKAIAAQAAAAIENARLIEEALASEALEKQVRMAADVQQRMVPQQPPVMPGVELASVYVPCFELGGDFFDFIPLAEENVGMIVADVSGKGVPASLIMASVRAFVRAQVDNVYYLYEIMRRVNLMLCRDTKPSEFVTCIYGVLDTRTRRFTYCNAGHPPALLLRRGELIELETQNMVLGVDPDEEFRQSFIDLEEGDVILLYTDGLSDAMNFQNETYGRTRILNAFKTGIAMPNATAETIAQHILWDMRRFVGLTKRTDDVTMIVARIR